MAAAAHRLNCPNCQKLEGTQDILNHSTTIQLQSIHNVLFLKGFKSFKKGYLELASKIKDAIYESMMHQQAFKM